MDSHPRKLRWFQFTTRRVLGAIFWMAICFSSAAVLSGVVGSDLAGFMAVAGVVLSPFLAVGTLVGRPLLGLVVGVVLVAAYAAALYVAIDNGWVSFP